MFYMKVTEQMKVSFIYIYIYMKISKKKFGLSMDEKIFRLYNQKLYSKIYNLKNLKNCILGVIIYIIERIQDFTIKKYF